jgi:hypothetical protein
MSQTVVACLVTVSLAFWIALFAHPVSTIDIPCHCTYINNPLLLLFPTIVLSQYAAVLVQSVKWGKYDKIYVYTEFLLLATTAIMGKLTDWDNKASLSKDIVASQNREMVWKI